MHQFCGLFRHFGYGPRKYAYSQRSKFEDLFTEFSEKLWLGLVDVIVMMDKKNFRVKFKSGMEVTVEL